MHNVHPARLIERHRICLVACTVLLLLAACGKKPVSTKNVPAPARPAATTEQHESAAEPDEAPPGAPGGPTNLRPVRVTVLEFGSPAARADVWIEHFSPTSSWWHARTREDGRATLLLPIHFPWFRVSASKAPNAIAAQFVRDLPRCATPLELTLNMTNRGVVITALIETPQPQLFSNITVRIDPETDADWNDVSISRVVNPTSPRVVLPPIRRGLQGLRVEVMSPRCATSFSEYFDTCDGRDKTIRVMIVPGARVYGTARLADGSAAHPFTLYAKPAGTHGLKGGAGEIYATQETDANGAYECGRFAADFYRIRASYKNMQSIYTNLLVEDDGTQLDFSFVPKQMMAVRGRVLAARDQQPVAGVCVEVEYPDRTSATTDVAGAFLLHVPYDDQFYCNLHLACEGYAAFSYSLDEQYQGEELVLMLRDTALIHGTITYESGTPATNISIGVNAYEENSWGPRGRTALGEDSHNSSYEYTTAAPSDAYGAYVISNVAAPETYRVYVCYDDIQLLKPHEDDNGIAVTLGSATQCDLIVKRKPCLFLKVCDHAGTVRRAYNVIVQYTTSGNNYSGSMQTSARPDADGWEKISLWETRTLSSQVSIQVKTEDGLMAETNHIRVSESGDQHLTITVVSNASRGICGFVYNSENEPLVDANIGAYNEHGHRHLGSTDTDHLGFFELPGSGAPTNEVVHLYLWNRQQTYETNVYESAEPVIWVIEPGCTISGRVCLENASQPATNFGVGFYLYQRTSMRADDGRFSLPVHEHQSTSGVVYAWVGEYAPASKNYLLQPVGDTDIGDIIVMPSSCTVRGRVVNSDGTPLEAQVAMRAPGDNEFMASIVTDAREGTFEFTRLPTGSYYVAAIKPHFEPVKSEVFTLSANQEYTVPDVVVCTTNAVCVRLVFVKADGTPAAHLSVSQTMQTTDASGAIEDYIPLGHHEQWMLYGDNQQYYAESFDVTPATRELRVMLLPHELMEGAVTLDGAPLHNGYLTLFDTHMMHDYGASVSEGTFSCKAQPGTYYAVCQEKSLMTTATLAAGANNQIAFVSGSASLTVAMPAAGQWHGSLQMKIDDHEIPVGHRSVRDAAALELQGLQAGDYVLHVFGEANGTSTNIRHEIQISNGQRASISFK